jgi:hypothetical protein
MLARHLLPGRLAIMLTEGNDAIFLLRRKENAPAIIRHLHIVELGPAARIDRIGRAQVHQRLLEALGPHVVPPVDIAGVPAFEGFEHLAVRREIHVVRNLGGVVDVHDVHVHGALLGPFSLSSWPGLTRPSTSCRGQKVVDARVKPGHDGNSYTLVISNFGFWPLP